MEYGCIGEKLKHSFSKEIHNLIAEYEYEIREIAKDKLDRFAKEADFKAINVTIPYKELIIPHLSWIDEHAKLIGAVNTVVKREGKLYGYNTDFYGMTELIKHAKINVCGKKVAILGTGGTSKTAKAVLRSLGAKEVLTVSRKPSDNQIDYETLVNQRKDVQIVINTTPCGMFPDNYNAPINLDDFPKVEGVIDAVYNPLRTRLISQALSKGIPAEGGLYMLVAQAVKACEIFADKKLPNDIVEETFNKIISQKQNVVLIGMPASGKTTVGGILAKKLNRQVIDVDQVIESQGRKIVEIFESGGENEFREIESQVIKTISKNSGIVISTGGGAILKEENVKCLKQNGVLYFIDRPLQDLIPTKDRPLSNDIQSITQRYNERYHIYNAVCDVRVDASCTAEQVAKIIAKDFE